MLCVIAPPSVFWSQEMMVSTLLLVISMRIQHANDHEGNDDHLEEHIGIGDADHYESLIVQRVLSTQMERVEQNQRHTLFQTKCVIKE
jgi:hypothetical protein